MGTEKQASMREQFQRWRAEHPHLVLYPDVSWEEGYRAGAEAQREAYAVLNRIQIYAAQMKYREHDHFGTLELIEKWAARAGEGKGK